MKVYVACMPECCGTVCCASQLHSAGKHMAAQAWAITVLSDFCFLSSYIKFHLNLLPGRRLGCRVEEFLRME
jgi:hypothetical protein